MIYEACLLVSPGIALDRADLDVLTQASADADWEEGDEIDPAGAVRLRLSRGTALSVTCGEKEVWSK